MAAEDSLGNAVLGTEVSLKGLDQGISDAEARAESGFSHIGNIISGALKIGLAAAAAGVVAFGAVLKGGIDDARAHQLVMAQTEQTITSMGNAAGVSAEHVESLAASLSAASGKSLFGDDQVQAATNMLLTFGNIKGEMLDFATVLTVDMAQALKKTPEDMSIMVGKILNSADAMSAAQRQGVSFSDEQLKLGKRLFETGHIAEYQKLVLDELNKEFGGQAEAAAKADGGWAQFHDRLGEAAETMGAAVLPLLSDLAGFLNDTIVPIVESAAAGFGELVQAFETGAANGGGAIGGLANALYRLDGVSPIFDTLGDAVVTLGGLFDDAFSEGGGTGVLLDDIREMTGLDLSPLVGTFQDVASAAQGLFDIFFNRDFTGGIFGLQEDDPIIGTLFDLRDAITGLAGELSATFTDAANPIEGFLNVLSEVSPAFALLYGVAQETLPQIEALVSQVLGDIIAYFEANGAEMVGQAQTTWQSVHDTVLSLIEPLAEVINAALAQISAFWQAHGDEILATTGQIYTQINDIIQVAMQLIQATVVPALQFLAQFINDHGAEIQAAFSGAWQIISSVIDAALTLIRGVLTAALQAINGDWSGAWQTIQDMSARFVTDILGVITGGLQLIKASFDTTIDLILGIWNGLIGKSAGIGNDIINGLLNGLKAGGDQIISYMRNLAAGALQSAKDALGISSPSSVFADEVGVPIVEGIIDGVSSTANAFYNILSDVATGGVDVMRDAGDRFGEVLRESSAPDDATDLGTNIMEGLIQGVEDHLQGAIDAMQGAADQMLGTMADALDIHSPSQVFAGIGEMSMLGLLGGLEGMLPDLLEGIQMISTQLIISMSDMTEDAKKEAEDLVDSLASIMEELPDRVHSALADAFDATASIDRQKARNTKALEDIGAAVMKTTDGGILTVTAAAHRDLLRQQLAEAEQVAAAMNDPEQAAKFYKMRSSQIFELAKLQQGLAAAQTDTERNSISQQIADIQKAQQAEQAAFGERSQITNNNSLSALADQLQAVLNAVPDAGQNPIWMQLYDLLVQINNAQQPPPGQGGQGLTAPSSLLAGSPGNFAMAGTTVSISVDARGATNAQAIEDAGYRGAKKALDEAGVRADVFKRTRR
jgi:hypothetical protein